MINLKELGDSYSKERPLFEELAKTVTEDLRPALRRAGIRAVLDGRAKEVPNLLRKALAKHYEDSAQITDKAGVRVIVNYQGDAFGVEKLIDEQFTVVERQ